MSRAIEVVEPGPLTLVQDLGRRGHLAVGVGRAGAADVASYLIGGRLLGNPPGPGAVEATWPNVTTAPPCATHGPPQTPAKSQREAVAYPNPTKQLRARRVSYDVLR